VVFTYSEALLDRMVSFRVLYGCIVPSVEIWQPDAKSHADDYT